jgi:hypothetical protein
MVTDEAVSRGDIYLVSLNPTRGSEIRKTRPCVVVSPDELNAHLRTFIVAPLTTGGHPYPFRGPLLIWSVSRISGKGAGLSGGTGCALAGDIAKVGTLGSLT